VKGRVYRDKGGELWLDPGDGALLSLDGQVLRALRDKWGVVGKPAAEEKFGPLTELTDPREQLSVEERYPLLVAAEGKTPAETLGLVLRVTGRARDADDARDLLEACGLRRYEKGERR
jgi:hypothetical protein